MTTTSAHKSTTAKVTTTATNGAAGVKASTTNAKADTK